MGLIKGKLSRRGTMAVEAAIMMPLLVLMTFGLLKFGWIYIKVEQINNAARHGVRVAIRADAESADVNAAIDALMASAGITGYSVTISPTSDIPVIDTGVTLTVTISVPFEGTDLDLIPLPLIPVPATLESSVSMAKEGT